MYKYKASVIVPIYNSEKYLERLFSCIFNQTYDLTKIQVILIDDGSTDNSLSECVKYQDMLPVIDIIHQDNAGVSAARNRGLEEAEGEYIFFLDSDDQISPCTVKNVIEVFDKYWLSADVCTYPINKYDQHGTKQKYYHFRYLYLKDNGVYSLEQYPYVLQTTMNICIKHSAIEDTRFNTKMKVHEDLAFINEMVMKKKAILFCKNAEYLYFVTPNSATDTNLNSLFLFEPTTRYYEELFSKYTKVPKYLQAMFLNDLSWKLKESILFPHYLDDSEYDKAIIRIKKLMSKVDDTVIIDNPFVDNFHRHYFLSFKLDADETVGIASNDNVSVWKNALCLGKAEAFEIIVTKVLVVGETLHFCGHIKDGLFNYIEKPKLFVTIKGVRAESEIMELKLFLSGDSYYKSRELTNRFWEFEYVQDIRKVKEFYFNIAIDGFCYGTYLYFMNTAPFSLDNGLDTAIYSNCTIWYQDEKFYVQHYNKEEILRIRHSMSEKVAFRRSDIANLRYRADSLFGKRIWLYYDCAGVAKDNGWYQFEHDFDYKDGIERYYVCTNNGFPYETKYMNNIVDFGSIQHKILYLASEKILTAFIEDNNFVPFERDDRSWCSDIISAEVVYLQHGILHAHLPWKYSPARIEATKIVVSSEFEYNNFTKIYGFNDNALICSGMPRFDLMHRNSNPDKKILYAPTWRKYLISETDDNNWEYNEEQFEKSVYYNKISEFLNSDELVSILEKSDFYLDFKLHPIFEPYAKLFNIKNERVSCILGNIENDEYAIFVTDFSSFVFDFAYYERPIIYFVPDILEFKSGMNGYYKLDMPLEDAFGFYTNSPKEAALQLEKIIKNDCVAEPKYASKMHSFYYDLNDCSDKLYEALINDE